MTMCLCGVLVRGSIIFVVMLGGGAVGLGRFLVMFGGFLVCFLWHVACSSLGISARRL